jgi:ELWxxDGT repeat protein
MARSNADWAGSKSGGIVLIVLALALGSPLRGTAAAADVLLSGKVVVVKESRLFKLVARGTFAIPAGQGPSDPTTSDIADLTVTDTGGLGSLFDDLSVGAWQALGSDALNPTGFRYRHSAAPTGGSVRLILMRPNFIKIVAEDDGTLNPPAGGDLTVQLSVGSERFCASFGGTTLKNVVGLTKRTQAPPPAACPVEPCEPGLVTDLNPGGAGAFPEPFPGLVIAQLASVNGSLLFEGHDAGSSGLELWKSDGSPAGTVLVKDIRPGSGVGSDMGLLTPVGAVLFFRANDGTHGAELWRSDGTTSGTHLVKDIRGGVNGADLRLLTNVGGTLYFGANDGTGLTLWKSDGTEAGTVPVKNGPPGPVPSTPVTIADVNGIAFFQAFRDSSTLSLWKTDGSAIGTTVIADVDPTHQCQPGMLFTMNVGGMVFFASGTTSTGCELWKSDGTAAGTALVRDITVGPAGSLVNPVGGVNLNGTFLFPASDGSTGFELWRSDGTAAGTVLVKDIRPGPLGSVPSLMAASTTAAFFVVSTADSYSELWKSDGTEPGTALVKEINPGMNGSYPGCLRVVNDSLFFRADDGTSGYEPWQSDGTGDGTSRIMDANPGLASSNPCSFTAVDERVFFQANDGSHGPELWTTCLQ